MNSDENNLHGDQTKGHLVTIDELTELSQKLTDGLRRLGDYKHPLDVRRGRKGVRHLTGNDEGQIVRAGSKTYFFDIKKTKNDKPYLVITESRFKGEGGDRERSSIAIFQEHISEFLEALQQIVDKLG